MSQISTNTTQPHDPHETQPHPQAPSRAANERVIAAVVPPPGFHWVGDGFRVAGYFSAIPDAARKLSPFLLLDYHAPFHYPATTDRRGVGPHPHRGFETVTLAWEGSVAHHDSAGNRGVIGPGDVQWMTAASGILHQEYHDATWASSGGPFHMVQLWVNLPRAHKMAPPSYQALLADQMGKVDLPDGSGQVRVIAGSYQGARGPARTFTPVDLLDTRLNAGGSATFSFPPHHNTSLLLMKGELSIGGKPIRDNDFVVFANQGTDIAVHATTNAHFLVLNGEPIDEPVVQYGPFVMNTQQEILQAIADLRSGRFGILED